MIEKLSDQNNSNKSTRQTAVQRTDWWTVWQTGFYMAHHRSVNPLN